MEGCPQAAAGSYFLKALPLPTDPRVSALPCRQGLQDSAPSWDLLPGARDNGLYPKSKCMLSIPLGTLGANNFQYRVEVTRTRV